MNSEPIAKIPEQWRVRLYRPALERGYLDSLLTDYIVRPILRLLAWCDASERRWTDFLSGGQSRESDLVSPSEIVEEWI